MAFLSFSSAFGLLAVLHVSWIQNSNFVLFVVNVLIKEEIEKPSGQYLSLIVMIIDLPRFEFKCEKFRWFYLYLCFMWRIVFGCLVVCR
jgi:hypothetical protein